MVVGLLRGYESCQSVSLLGHTGHLLKAATALGLASQSIRCGIMQPEGR